MAVITWSGNATDPVSGTNPANPANWVGGVAPTSADIAQFIGSGVTGCISVSALNWGGINATAAETQPLTFNYPITTSGTISFDNTSALTLASGVTITGDGDFHIGTTLTSFPGSGASLDLQGNGNFDIDKTPCVFYDGKFAYSGKTTTFTGSSSSPGIQFRNSINVNSGTLTLNQRCNVAPSNGCTTPIIINGTPTINGTSAIYIYPATQTTHTFSLPAMTLTNTGGIYIQPAGSANARDWVILQSGNISTTSFRVYQYANNLTISGVYNTNNYGITCSDTFAIGGGLGNSVFQFNAGSSTISAAVVSGTYNTGTTYINMGTSQWNCQGDWTFGSTHTVNPGTSQLTFTGASANYTLTSNGESLYTVIENTAGRTLTLVDDLSCNTFNNTAGSFDNAGFNITSASDITLNGAGTTALSGGTITITGDGNFNVGTAITTFTNSNTSVDLQGNGNLDIDKNLGVTAPFYQITCAYPDKTTTNTGATSALNLMTTALVVNGGILNLGSTGMGIGCIDAVTPLTLVPGYTVTGDAISQILLYKKASGATAVTLPEIVFTTVSLVLYNNNIAGALTFTMGGSITCGIFNIYTANQTTGTITLNTNNYAITATEINWRSAYVNRLVVNCGSSLITCTGFRQTSYNQGAINLESSIWRCSGGWTNAINYVFVPGTSTINFITNDLGVNPNDKPFYNVICSGNTTTFSGGYSCNSLQIEPNSYVVFPSASSIIISGYTSDSINGDWYQGNLRSSTPDTATNLTLPSNMRIYGNTIKDMNASNLVLSLISDSNVNSGGNSNFKFMSTSVSPSMLNAGLMDF